tara:strand:+ start:1914 stop:2339 length:426 start_codon:yes stop_codon:yes gene_type:complete
METKTQTENVTKKKKEVKSYEELIERLTGDISSEKIDDCNAQTKRVRTDLSHLDSTQKAEYNRLYQCYCAKKIYIRNTGKDKDTGKDVNLKKQEYYNKNKEVKQLQNNYNYYKRLNRLDCFKEKKPASYDRLVELNIIEPY